MSKRSRTYTADELGDVAVRLKSVLASGDAAELRNVAEALVQVLDELRDQALEEHDERFPLPEHFTPEVISLVRSFARHSEEALIFAKAIGPRASQTQRALRLANMAAYDLADLGVDDPDAAAALVL
jgi:hypothetical protein